MNESDSAVSFKKKDFYQRKKLAKTVSLIAIADAVTWLQKILSSQN